jgi:type IX secretion system PorP/SprF family membrane protein
MLKNSIYLIILFTYLPIVHSQDYSFYSNYQTNNFFNLNSAAAGFDGAFISQISVSTKWMGLADAPTCQVFSNSIRLGEEEFYDPNKFVNRPFINLANRVGLGLTLYNESNGPVRHTGILFAYSNHFPIRNSRLSFGISWIISQYALNTEKFKAVQPNDPYLYTNSSTIVPDVNLGILYYNQMMFMGISVNGVANYKEVMDRRKNIPDFILCGGYKFSLNKLIKFEPSLFVLNIGQKTISYDINNKLYFKGKNWLILAYRSTGELMPGLGIGIKSWLQMAYNCIIGTGGIESYAYESHQIALRIDISALMKRHNKPF